MTHSPGNSTTLTQGISIALPAGDLTSPPSVGWVGDWLLEFSPGAGDFPARLPAANWRIECQGESWRLWSAPPVDGWRGMPLMRVQNERWAAWLVGELYGTADPLAAVADVIEGKASAATLNGHFLLLAHDFAAQEWAVWTNRLATLHAYWATDGTRAAVGTFSPAVAAATGCASLDWEALTAFFGFGFFAGDRTYRQGVRILRPATCTRIDEAGRVLGQERYWRWQFAPEAERTYDETVEEFADLFGRVMGELTAAGRIALPISGGLDSRSTVAAIAPDSPVIDRLWAYSYGYRDDSVETRIAGQLAAARGLPFTGFTISPYLFDRLPQIMAAVEGFQDVTQARQAAIVDELGEHADYLIAAHWGDVYLDDMGVATLGVGTHGVGTDDLVGQAVKKFNKGGNQWLLDRLCRPQLGAAEPQQLLHDMIAAELERVGTTEDADFRIKMLKSDQWSARWTTASLRMFQAAAFPRLPFYDIRLMDFFCSVPTEYVRGRRLQIDYLRRYAPDLARVPWQVTGRSLFHDQGDTAVDVARRAARKGWRLVRGRRVIERNWEVQFMSRGGREALEGRLLRPGLALHEFVAPQEIETLLDAFYRDPYTEKRGYTVSMLLTFSAWLETQAGRVWA